ncbi:MAG: Crp/Fnr family transcriptional regulator [Pseudomonadota bacterium]
MDEKKFLRETKWLSQFSDGTAEAILDRYKILTFAHGDAIYRKGDRSDGVYCVTKGCMRYSAVTIDGYETTLWIVGAGEWDGFGTIFDDGGRLYDTYAVGETRLAMIANETINELMANWPEFAPAMIKSLARAIRDTAEDVEMILSRSPEQLLAWRLEVLCVHSAGRNEIELTQDEMAALIGASRQTVRNILQNWSEQQIVEVRYGKLRILTPETLKSIWK